MTARTRRRLCDVTAFLVSLAATLSLLYLGGCAAGVTHTNGNGDGVAVGLALGNARLCAGDDAETQGPAPSGRTGAPACTGGRIGGGPISAEGAGFLGGLVNAVVPPALRGLVP